MSSTTDTLTKAPAAKKRSLGLVFSRHPETGALIVAAVLIVVFGATSGGVWLNTGNLQSILHVTAILALLAAGEALVICTGEIDISIGSIVGMGAFVFLGTAPLVGVLPAVVLAIGAGCTIGAFNGYLASYLGISSLIVTLGTLFVFRGLAYMLSEGWPFQIDTATRASLALYGWFGSGTIFGFQNSIVWMLLVLAALHVTMFYTPFGNRLLAIGGHKDSALSRGVQVRFVRFLAFVIAGACAAFAGVLEANKIGFADGTTGRLMELEAIAACVVGGCLLAGGRISIVGALAGAFILSGIQSYLVVMSVSPQFYLMVLAALVIAALLGDNQFRAWAVRRR
jgi:simple sugar transport system permease protein/ribose transport system permease protein